MTAGNQPAAVLVLGVGRPDRGDDAVGPAVAERAMELVPPGVTVVQRVEPAELIDTWAGAGLVVVTDAVRSGQPPGTVHVLHACHGPLPVRTGAGGTHGLGLAEVIELGRALRRLPPELVVVGVEAQQFGLGEPMSPQVRACVELAAKAVAEVVRTG
ncbi:MAG TPA: hydrogenase maturation protease [Streptosporangiaceae bacterium]|nr:hydrogenase maturation protease [Streptosporangiaceae bacterium]